MDELLKEIGIQGTLVDGKNGTKVLEIEGSDNYGRIYSRLDNSDLVDEDEESSQMTSDTASTIYESEDYIITLLADFNADEYKLTIKER